MHTMLIYTETKTGFVHLCTHNHHTERDDLLAEQKALFPGCEVRFATHAERHNIAAQCRAEEVSE